MMSIGKLMRVRCNLSSTSLMFAVSYKGMRMISMIPTLKSILMLGAYSKFVCANMGGPSLTLTKTSTKPYVVVVQRCLQHSAYHYARCSTGDTETH